MSCAICGLARERELVIIPPKERDPLGDRMKSYESVSDVRLDPSLPILARIDGRAFHSFTRGMDRPFDVRFTRCMLETTRGLMEETNACMGYTQSDEISLAWHVEPESEVWFGGRLSKMTSQLAAHATLRFYRSALVHLADFVDRHPTFDARVWSVPNRAEGANAFLWRELDAIKNSVTMLSLAHFSHRELQGVTTDAKREMLRAKGIDWEQQSETWKRGCYFQRRTIRRPFNAAELESLPPLHHARKNPELVIERSQIQRIELPPLLEVVNREAVIFEGADPEGRVLPVPALE